MLWLRQRVSALAGQGVVIPSTFVFFPTDVCGHHSRGPTVIRGLREPFPKIKNTAYPFGYAVFLVEATGLAPLASRPAPTLSTSGFAIKFRVFPSFVRQSVLLPQNGSHPQVPLQRRNNKKIQHINDVLYFLVEATGLEPTTSWSLTKRATKLRYASICRLTTA